MFKSLYIKRIVLVAVLVTSLKFVYSQNVHFEPFYDLQAVNFKADGVVQTWMGEVPGLTQHFWVLGQEGTLWSLYPTNNGNYEKAQLFDETARVNLVLGHEYGAYDIAFHPDFLTNKKFYFLTLVFRDLSNTDRWKCDLVLEEWTASGDLHENVEFVKEVMRIPHEDEAFGTASMLFGQDGFLYLSVSDYYNNGWDLKKYGRKVLRIDIDNPEGDKEYGIPSDNPYVSNHGDTALTEIWASGIRNGWTMTLAPNGDLYVGDVGQWQDEEINLILPGRNYGWRDGGDGLIYVGDRWNAEFPEEEGGWSRTGRGFSGFCADRDYNPTVHSNIDCNDFEDPVWRFKNRTNDAFTIDCIILGPVVNGDPSDPLFGMLLFADNTSNKIYAVDPANPTEADNDPGEGPMEIADLGELGSASHDGIVGFSEDGYGNIYVVSNSWNQGQYKELYVLTGLTPRDEIINPTLPAKQSKFTKKSELIFISGNKHIRPPAGSSTASLYSLKGDVIWQTDVNRISEIPVGIAAGVYRIIYQ